MMLQESTGQGEMWWVDSTPVSSNNWATDQPSPGNDHGQNCAAAYTVENYKWRVESCYTQNKFMCQKEYGIMLHAHFTAS